MNKDGFSGHWARHPLMVEASEKTPSRQHNKTEERELGQAKGSCQKSHTSNTQASRAEQSGRMSWRALHETARLPRPHSPHK